MREGDIVVDLPSNSNMKDKLNDLVKADVAKQRRERLWNMFWSLFIIALIIAAFITVAVISTTN